MSFYLRANVGTIWPALVRTLRNRSLDKPIPSATKRIPSLSKLLKSFGRGADTKVQVPSWSDFWKLNGVEMKKMGLSVKDRRYFLWCMNKFRLGFDPSQFAHPEKPKKTIRGRGPAVQNGKRIRSRRKR